MSNALEKKVQKLKLYNPIFNYMTHISNNISPQISQVYEDGFIKFWECIPEDYIKRDKLIDTLIYIKRHLLFVPPEAISREYCERVMSLIKYLPNPGTDWSTNAWNTILQTSKIINKILIKNKINTP